VFEKTKARIAKYEETHANAHAALQHVRDNKATYMVGAGMFGAGLIIRSRPELKQVIGSFNVMYKSDMTNVTVTQLARRGHPGYMIKCVDTGETYASIRRACEAMGLNRVEMYKHLQGEMPNVRGHIFENLGEMK
jgi:hypothetical protein